jgi:hypothetical protein
MAEIGIKELRNQSSCVCPAPFGLRHPVRRPGRLPVPNGTVSFEALTGSLFYAY